MAGRVAVIGAGSSGIAAVKVLEEAGFSHIVCFERRDMIGGLWHYHDETARWVDEGCVNRGTVANTSKEILAFSDYPMPDDYPNFCHNSMIDKYLNSYATHFGVHRFIRLNTEVTQVKKHSTFESTGRWQVTSRDIIHDKSITEVFDYIIIANGNTAHPRRPSFPGQDKFRGKTMHSMDFKDSSGWEGKKSCVVGIGNSGTDIACELSNYSPVLLSVRSGAWFLNRLTHRGLPWDFSYHSRFQWIFYSWMPRMVHNTMKRRLYSQVVDHQLYGLNPPEAPDASVQKITDEFPNKIACGLVKIKPNIREFTETGIIFEDGTREYDVDLVVFATGYSFYFPFLNLEDLGVTKEATDMKLYKHMWVPDMPHHTLALLNAAQYAGAGFPNTELQSRLAAGVFKGDIRLPSPEKMKAEMARYDANLKSRYVSRVRNPRRVEYLPYMDELASLVGCKPNLAWYLITDPVLFLHLLFGPGVPYQYRLQGPNIWPEARNAILTVMDRVRKPFENFQPPEAKRRTTSSYGILTTSKYLFAGFIFCAMGYGAVINLMKR